MRVLGIDHGNVRIGLALSDESGAVARPLQIVKHVSREADAETVARIAAEKEAKLIVIGLPTDSDGNIGHQARKVQRWAEALKQATAIPIELWDETFSSQEADTLPAHKRGEPNDALAAALILQSYLDSHPQPPNHPTT
ncbi:MAG: Holliday junction resolvase RuvX [Chloroflexi bacterium]|nr:Holliday junction resolvase RuvX [Chloroflexota bacterium]